MREILFRAKISDEVRGFNSLPNGTWVYGFYMDKVGCPVVYQFEQSRADYVEYEVDRETVGQFTGLTDKNGKQIFEGDIVGCFGNTQIFEIKWCDIRGGYFLDDVILSSCCEPGPECLGNLTDTIEVLGNIYDNPELLKGDNDE